ncbi:MULTISPECIES: hypothetical protein [unclassified Roseofilum]|nr:MULTISPECIES: hypothetical protein [unclassified Roseofilum]MBP0008688.1 hypothetical protein [Roseofilum sp. Belize Diploria]MBP0033097.1 hypothetical protein [Roseofilum sp. Belize BBD 4]
MPQNYQDLQQFSTQLTNLKNNLVNDMAALRRDIQGEIDRGTNYLKAREKFSGWGWIVSGLIILIMVAWISNAGIYSSNSSSRSSSNQIQRGAAWYETGYPKQQCGHSSSSNNCWHPVFITYTSSNWNKIVRNCRDVPNAQSQSTARERGKIQIASFNNSTDAEGFAKFMDRYYSGDSWIGETKCY